MLSAKDANDRADQLLAMATRLSELVSDEIAAMDAGKLDGARVNSSEKERLVHAWRLEIQQVRADPGLLAGLSADRKAALREISVALQSKLEGHSASLVAMKTVTEGLVRSIAEEVSRARAGPAGYGRDGYASRPAPGGGSGMAVNAKV